MSETRDSWILQQRSNEEEKEDQKGKLASTGGDGPVFKYEWIREDYQSRGWASNDKLKLDA